MLPVLISSQHYNMYLKMTITFTMKMPYTALRTRSFSFLPSSYHCHVQVHPLLFKIIMIFFFLSIDLISPVRLSFLENRQEPYSSFGLCLRGPSLMTADAYPRGCWLLALFHFGVLFRLVVPQSQFVSFIGHFGRPPPLLSTEEISDYITFYAPLDTLFLFLSAISL